METTESALVIVGAGHAGSELAVSARQQGWAGPIMLLGEEGFLPYQRPPLSKAFLAGTADAESLALRSQSAYDSARIELRLGARMTRIDRAARYIELADGTHIHYSKLALCTGGRPRQLACAGIDAHHHPTNLLYLRTQKDAEAIRSHLQSGSQLVVIGGGYVGLEVAASAIALGAKVTLLEAQPRVLARVAGPALSTFYESVHRAAGVDVRTGVSLRKVHTEAGRIDRIECEDGESFKADMVVAGLGMLVNDDAARVAGLATDAGLEVDAFSCTRDPDIVAAGDCTVHHSPLYERTIRLESVPNALDQARAAAAWLCGKPKPNHGVPWFWSDQYDLKLQMVGLSQGYDRCVLRGATASRSFCAFYLQGDRLLAVDAVNRPGDFMVAKRALAKPVTLPPEIDLADESRALKDVLAVAPPVAVTGNH
ncbi:pyridine nucleotide-disulfide oxidoreductase [Variovorax sp. WS11]|nr:FAD-dependent oxidoreductase [Variovorax sp. WS11]NDZ18891.1 FAD-dependent oxidoreductase [Variovorax sp. WS11]PSL80057.1 pyridine nucleotide-disulfide oxidoreductase [Variovorax sp. WS11]